MKKQTRISLGILLLAAPIFLHSFIINVKIIPALSEAKTDAGIVAGVPNGAGDITAFKGIPFAAPPVGDLRWKAPQPTPHWGGIRKCDAFSASPMQAAPKPFIVYTSEF